eukprot:gene2591-2834_t
MEATYMSDGSDHRWIARGDLSCKTTSEEDSEEQQDFPEQDGLINVCDDLLPNNSLSRLKATSESAINADLLAMVAAFSPDISMKDLAQEIDLSPLPKHRSFFETFFVPSCYKFRNLKDPWMTPSLEKLRSKGGPVIGRSHLIKGMGIFCTLPDIIVKLKGSCIQHTPDGPGSKVIMSTECINSFIDETLVEYTDKDGVHKVTNSLVYDCMLLSGLIEPSCCVRKHLVAPGYMERTLQSVIIFHLDNIHRIYCIEVIGKLERTPKSF